MAMIDTHTCPACAASERARAAAVAETMTLREVLKQIRVLLAPKLFEPLVYIREIIDNALADPSPAVGALERALERLRADKARLEQLEDELAAVDGALGEYYMPVLDENDEPCGAFYKDHGVNVMAQALEEAERRLAPMPCGHPGACADDVGHCKWCDDEAELIAELEQATSEITAQRLRAEALAELVPEAQGVVRKVYEVLNGGNATRESVHYAWQFLGWHLADNSLKGIAPKITGSVWARLADIAWAAWREDDNLLPQMRPDAREVAEQLRALAARIEEARGKAK